MPYARSRQSGLSRWVVALLFCVSVPVTAAGAVGALWAFGKIDPVSWFQPKSRLPEGCVAVMASGMKIPAYTKITREHLMDPATGGWAFVPLREADIPKEVILLPTDVIGRVLKHDKHPGYAFTEKDFLPKGTRPGLAGAIPPGKRSLTLERTKIQGIVGLQPQDHFDLTATIPVEVPKGSGNMNKGLTQQMQLAATEKLARVRVLAKDAVLIQFTQHDKTVISKSISQGTQAKKIPVEEVVIAVGPDEVAAIEEALATEVAVTCVVRSGQPGDDGVATTGSDPLSGINVIDAISGDKRESIVLPDYSRHTTAKPSQTATASGTQKSDGAFWENLTEAAKAQ